MPDVILAPDHKGMKVDYTGMLRQAREALRGGLHAEMLRQLQEHLKELGERFYAGDVAAVDEFLQLYCIALDRRPAGVTPCNPVLAQVEAEQRQEDEYHARRDGVVVGPSGSDWVLVGHFMEDDGRWLKMDSVYATDPDAVALYRKRNAGVEGRKP